MLTIVLAWQVHIKILRLQQDWIPETTVLAHLIQYLHHEQWILQHGGRFDLSIQNRIAPAAGSQWRDPIRGILLCGLGFFTVGAEASRESYFALGREVGTSIQSISIGKTRELETRLIALDNDRKSSFFMGERREMRHAP